MARKFWWPNKLSEQFVVVTNFREKIDKYMTPLGLQPEELAEIKEICDGLKAVYEYINELQAHSRQIFEWRDRLFFGKETGQAMNMPAAINNVPAMAYSEGSLKIFFKFRERIMALPGYEESIGIDLGLYGPERSRLNEKEIAPRIHVNFYEGGKIEIKGSLRRLPAMQIEYAPDGGEFRPAAFITETPATIQITTQSPGQPEKGSIRAIYFNHNQPVGDYSNIFNVTLY